ncbi:Peroxisomal acyl-coenzyme A oxidase 3 [Chionoecetes opilio]|uniref:Peroxisomal acyl-coenzyme A oxidase 3 n=1 Tax=Chionoecetes opilio TaxID=41210 RepID=A0A8J5CIU9_CHIOP|nr:Peroxisomal acyl-coenzyme A oxidase 3 [Chionoecetes opilio]
MCEQILDHAEGMMENEMTEVMDRCYLPWSSRVLAGRVVMAVVCVLQQVALTWFEAWVQEAHVSLQPVLYRLCALFGLNQLEKHMTPLVEGGLVVDRSLITAAQQHVRRLCGELLPDAVALVDAFAPPDFFLHSVLGNADGKVYQHMKTAMFTAPNATSRAKHWQEMVYAVPPAKL